MTKINRSNFFKYLKDDSHKDWGITCKTTGYFHSPPGQEYPPPAHPSSHAFEWESGRILNDFYIIYVITGGGVFETNRDSGTIKTGDLILLYSGDWHRYRPHIDIGWEEYWIGFNGSYIKKYIVGELFPDKSSYIKNIGYQPEVILLLDQIIELSKKRSLLYSRVLYGCLFQILAYFCTLNDEKIITHRGSYIIQKSVEHIRQNLTSKIDFKVLARTFSLSYSRYRSIFKSTTGLSPQQFFINERIECAKRLLRNTEMDIKEVAFKSGFQSPPYFSRIFHQKTGLTPSEQRENKPLRINNP